MSGYGYCCARGFEFGRSGWGAERLESWLCPRGGKYSRESAFCGISSKKMLAQTQVIARSGFYVVGFSIV